MDQFTNTKDLVHVPNGSITRFKAKDLKETLNGLIVLVSIKAKLGDLL
jgi:hypothetical protein